VRSNKPAKADLDGLTLFRIFCAVVFPSALHRFEKTAAYCPKASPPRLRCRCSLILRSGHQGQDGVRRTPVGDARIQPVGLSESLTGMWPAFDRGRRRVGN
jgi:hypothetical protein